MGRLQEALFCQLRDEQEEAEMILELRKQQHIRYHQALLLPGVAVPRPLALNLQDEQTESEIQFTIFRKRVGELRMITYNIRRSNLPGLDWSHSRLYLNHLPRRFYDWIQLRRECSNWSYLYNLIHSRRSKIQRMSGGIERGAKRTSQVTAAKIGRVGLIIKWRSSHLLLCCCWV
jgi:hypothetical protein